MTPRVSSYTVIFAVRYVPVTVTGTVSTVTGTVSQFQTRGIPVRNLRNLFSGLCWCQSIITVYLCLILHTLL